MGVGVMLSLSLFATYGSQKNSHQGYESRKTIPGPHWYSESVSHETHLDSTVLLALDAGE